MNGRRSLTSQRELIVALESCAQRDKSARPNSKMARLLYALRETMLWREARITAGECRRSYLRILAILRNPRLRRIGGLPIESPKGSCSCFLDRSALLACNAYIQEQLERNPLVGPFELQILALAYLSGVQWCAHRGTESCNVVRQP
jgi:hypothetical protein